MTLPLTRVAAYDTSKKVCEHAARRMARSLADGRLGAGPHCAWEHTAPSPGAR